MSKRATWKTWLLRSVIGVVLVGIVIGAWCIYQGVTVSLRAERALHATKLTFAVVEDYVKANNGAWPRLWKDLESLPPRSGGIFEWPDESEKLQEYVTIDFTADPADLAKQSPDEFEAIRPIGPHYPYKDYGEVRSLLETLSESSRD